jgi:hypothetical protein
MLLILIINIVGKYTFRRLQRMLWVGTAQMNIAIASEQISHCGMPITSFFIRVHEFEPLWKAD